MTLKTVARLLAVGVGVTLILAGCATESSSGGTGGDPAAELPNATNPGGSSAHQSTRVSDLRAPSGPKLRLAWQSPGLEQWKACPNPVWPAADLPADDPRRILVVGDSLTNYAWKPLTARLQERGWQPTLVCWGGEQTGWALEQLRDLKRQQKLPGTVVMATGTNEVHQVPCSTPDACQVLADNFGVMVKRVVDFLGPERRVVWLTLNFDLPKSSPHQPWVRRYPAFNEALRKVAAKRSNLQVIDWDAIVRRELAAGRSIPTTSDGYHFEPIDRPYESVGTMLRVDAITEAVGRPRI